MRLSMNGMGERCPMINGALGYVQNRQAAIGRAALVVRQNAEFEDTELGAFLLAEVKSTKWLWPHLIPYFLP